MKRAIEEVARIIEDSLEIAADIDPETGKIVLVHREGTYERAARAVLEHIACQ